MMNDVLSAERQATLVTSALIHSDITGKSSDIFPKIALTKSLHVGHLATTTDCFFQPC